MLEIFDNLRKKIQLAKETRSANELNDAISNERLVPILFSRLICDSLLELLMSVAVSLYF